MIKCIALLGGCLLAASAALAQAPVYSVTGLGNMGLQGAFASGLSQNGQVVGYGYALDPAGELFTQRAPFVYSAGVVTSIPDHNGLAVLPTGINDAGQIVGYSYTVDATFGVPNYQRALLSNGGPYQDIGTLGGTRARPRAINNAGQIAGTSRIVGSTDTHAFLYSGGVMTDLGAPADGRSSGTAINELGVVAGTITLPDFSVHAALFKAGGVVEDLGSLGGGSTTAVNGINDRGQIVGFSDTTEQGPNFPVVHAFVYEDGVMKDLGSFAGKEFTDATGINNRGQIVGLAFSGSEFDNQVFLWESGQMYDINQLLDPALAAGWTITGVYAINDLGQIAGDGILNGVRQAVLLTPVPEAPAAPMLLAGLVALAGWSRRHVRSKA